MGSKHFLSVNKQINTRGHRYYPFVHERQRERNRGILEYCVQPTGYNLLPRMDRINLSLDTETRVIVTGKLVTKGLKLHTVLEYSTILSRITFTCKDRGGGFL